MERTTTQLSHRKSARPHSARPIGGRSGFTLVELLVVIGIIVALAAILLPMLSKANTSAKRAQIQSDLIGIAQALDQYKHDWGDYPRTSTDRPNDLSGKQVVPSPGAVVLCWALIAPGPAMTTTSGQTFDGADGPGFRIRGTQGKVYGPYLNVDHYRYGTLKNDLPGSPALNLLPTGQPADNTQTMIADSEGNAILYFPANTAVSLSSTNAQLVAPGLPIGTPISATQQFVYNYGDNVPPLMGPTPAVMCSLTPKILTMQLGGSGGTPLIAPYVLLSAGHDGRFGPPYNPSGPSTVGDSDDVAYPDQLNPVPLGTAP